MNHIGVEFVYVSTGQLGNIIPVEVVGIFC